MNAAIELLLLCADFQNGTCSGEDSSYLLPCESRKKRQEPSIPELDADAYYASCENCTIGLIMTVDEETNEMPVIELRSGPLEPEEIRENLLEHGTGRGTGFVENTNEENRHGGTRLESTEATTAKNTPTEHPTTERTTTESMNADLENITPVVEEYPEDYTEEYTPGEEDYPEDYTEEYTEEVETE